MANGGYLPRYFAAQNISTTSHLYFEEWLCLLLPYYAEMSSVNAALRLRSAAESDMRISLTNQVVSGIRGIKARAWEDEFREKIKHTRK